MLRRHPCPLSRGSWEAVPGAEAASTASEQGRTGHVWEPCRATVDGRGRRSESEGSSRQGVRARGRGWGDAGVPPLPGGGAEHEQGAGTGCGAVADPGLPLLRQERDRAGGSTPQGRAGRLSPASRWSGRRGCTRRCSCREEALCGSLGRKGPDGCFSGVWDNSAGAGDG